MPPALSHRAAPFCRLQQTKAAAWAPAGTSARLLLHLLAGWEPPDRWWHHVHGAGQGTVPLGLSAEQWSQEATFSLSFFPSKLPRLEVRPVCFWFPLRGEAWM